MDNLTPITREEMLMNDEPLTPITREEEILAGEDLNPVTRREYFLKKYRHAGGDVMVEGLEVTANGTYTAPEGKAYSPVEVAVPLPENAYLLKEASGSLVSFSDGTDLPMPSFICDIDAVQDLHGYDAPWVGGAGKNKLPLVLADIKVDNTEGTWNGNTYIYNGVTIEVLQDINGNVNGFKFNGTASGNIRFSITRRNIENFPTGDYIYNIQNTIDIDNLWVSIYQPQSKAIKVKDSTNVEASITSGQAFGGGYIYSDAGNVFNNVLIQPMLRLATETDSTFAPYSNICPISGHTGVDAVISPTTEASAGTTYSVSWQTEAGEVFGGYVDLVSGVLTVTDGYVDLGTLSWIYDGDGVFRTIALNGSKLDGKSICSNYTQVTASWVNVTNGKYRIGPNDMRICDTNYTDATAFTTAMNGVQLVYELTTPITYQLTPTQIKSLLGNNNAWCDTGEVDVDYFAKEV